MSDVFWKRWTKEYLPGLQLRHKWQDVKLAESRGRVVTRCSGSQEVGGSIPGCATKFVRCKNLAFNIGECVSRGSDTT